MSKKPDAWDSWVNQTKNFSTTEILDWSLQNFSGGLGFATSLGPEDQVLLSFLQQRLSVLGLDPGIIDVFTLDTGRLPQETYELVEKNRKFFEIPLRLVFPRSHEVEALVNSRGPNAFYTSVEDRRQCCHVRKVLPLDEALVGKKAWITGLRRSQAPSRTTVDLLEWDEGRSLVKINPLVHWSADEIWTQIRLLKLPYNTLHDKGYSSIGCAPCTRAILPGEDERAGRWWWENEQHKECGLHVESRTPSRLSFQKL
ncbi:MAG: phosphoadenylyl-sulfate reductase [Spirochaetales bacterium]|nr:phosphoadenylyl-sulfate reductase [Spirochaetales bacterium]